uniref:Small ribosomal subunit protein bS18c n=1 Tax=Pleurastrum terricola TaxID=34116 RepID=RR18_PLETE|nr:ribosomal protein S18 [Pleurastrum terricola]A6YGA0.1 RecName: Full=Small ribosomal subunit protein bS18c; AltName: Full=30S ribosomal protein S18, chloroplastic [Pleurastrum terricola]ABO69316.1 ribosomal protein S18 [Pleurastrum terricola]
MKQPLKNTKRSNYKRKKRERVIALIPTKTNLTSPDKSLTPLPKEIIDYKNVILLRNGITAEGKIFPRRFTKLNAKQQRYMSKAIKNARMVGLLPFVKKSK